MMILMKNELSSNRVHFAASIRILNIRIRSTIARQSHHPIKCNKIAVESTAVFTMFANIFIGSLFIYFKIYDCHNNIGATCEKFLFFLRCLSLPHTRTQTLWNRLLLPYLSPPFFLANLFIGFVPFTRNWRIAYDRCCRVKEFLRCSRVIVKLRK